MLNELRRYDLALSMRNRFQIRNDEEIVNVSMETKTRNYWFLDGALSLNGTRNLNSIYRKEVAE